MMYDGDNNNNNKKIIRIRCELTSRGVIVAADDSRQISERSDAFLASDTSIQPEATMLSSADLR